MPLIFAKATVRDYFSPEQVASLGQGQPPGRRIQKGGGKKMTEINEACQYLKKWQVQDCIMVQPQPVANRSRRSAA